MTLQHITLACPQCSKQLRAPVAAAGKNGKCNGCGTQLVIPAVDSEAVTRTAAAQPPRAGRSAARSAAPPSATPSVKSKPATPVKAPLQPAELVSAQTSDHDFSAALSALIAEGDQHVRAHVSSRLSVAEVAQAITRSLPKPQSSVC